MEFIETRFGKLNLNQLPIVAAEPLDRKFIKSMAFFSVIILILLTILYYRWEPQHNVKVSIKKDMSLKTVKTHVKATSIYIQNVVSKKPLLENIVIIATSGNMMNFRPTALPNRSFKVDFGETLDITDIVLITGKAPENYITNLDITLYDIMQKTWEYSGPLLNKSENVIHISKMYYNPPAEEEIIEKYDTSNKLNSDKKLIINENELAVSLGENEEKYVSY
jgi:hypothetical protein